MATNQQINSATPRAGIDAHWLHAALSMKAHMVSRLAGRQAVPIVPKSQFEKLRLIVPSPADQVTIGRISGEWDRAIAACDALAKAKRLQFSWLRKHVLGGRIRLAGFAAPWNEARLFNLLNEHRNRSSGHEPVYSVSVHLGLVDQIEHLGRSFAAEQTSHYNRVSPGDIVYTKSPTGDFPLGIIKQSKIDREVIVSPLYGVFAPRTRDLGVFLDAYFSSPLAAHRYLAPLVQKGAKNTIAVTNDQFLQGAVNVPQDEGEIAALARLIELSLKEIKEVEGLSAALRLQKRGVLKRLLTGEWRIGQYVGDAES